MSDRIRLKLLPPGPPPSMRQIGERVAEKHGLLLIDLKSVSRTHALCLARWEAMHEMREARREDGSRRFSTPQIGQFLGGRDHATVVHGLRKFAEVLAATAPVMVAAE